MKKKALYGIGIALLILIVTNPSQKAFKEYLGSGTYEGLERTSNFFLCDIFENDGDEYLGVLGNFFWINKPEPIIYKYHGIAVSHSSYDSAMMADSAAMADSAKMKMADTGYSSKDQQLPPPPSKEITGYTQFGLPIYAKKTDTLKDPDPLNILAKPQYDKLYVNLLKAGFTKEELGTFEEFCANIKIKRKAIKLYDDLEKDGFTETQLGTKTEFLKTFCQK